MPVVRGLVEDKFEEVRSRLATEVMKMASMAGTETTVSHLLPIYLRLLNDPSTEVRLNIIGALEQVDGEELWSAQVNTVIGAFALAESLLPVIIQLAKDAKWRVRLAVLEFMPLLAAQLGDAFFELHLMPILVDFLSDAGI